MHERFLPANKCIYCGTTEAPLSAEHIIPYAFNGEMVLPAASCVTCAAITSADELIVLQQMYGNLRLRYNFKSRRRKRRPTELPYEFEDETGVVKHRYLSISTMPVVIPFLKLPEPGILTGTPPHARSPEMTMGFWRSDKELAQTVAEAEASSIKLTAFLSWGSLCRMLAKIAHSYTYATFGEKGYEPLVKDIILNKSEYLAHYVGGHDGEQVEGRVSIGFDTNDERILIWVDIRLLPNFLPTYRVITGRVMNFTELLESFTRRKEELAALQLPGRGSTS